MLMFGWEEKKILDINFKIDLVTETKTFYFLFIPILRIVRQYWTKRKFE